MGANQIRNMNPEITSKITELPDGAYYGEHSGYVFTRYLDGKHYSTKQGIRGIARNVIITVEAGKEISYDYGLAN